MAQAKNQPEDNPTLANVIQEVVDINSEKDAIYERLAEGRGLARSLVSMGQCSKVQREWVEKYLAIKKVTRKPKDGATTASNGETVTADTPAETPATV